MFDLSKNVAWGDWASDLLILIAHACVVIIMVQILKKWVQSRRENFKLLWLGRWFYLLAAITIGVISVAASNYVYQRSPSLWLVLFWGVVIGFLAGGAYDYLIEPFAFWEAIGNWMKKKFGVAENSNSEKEYIKESWERLREERLRIAQERSRLEKETNRLGDWEIELLAKEGDLAEREARIKNQENGLAARQRAGAGRENEGRARNRKK